MARLSDIKTNEITEDLGVSSGAKPVANSNALPTSGNSVGDFKITNDNKALHVWDGSEWDRISSGTNEGPLFTTEPNNLYNLSSLGTSTNVTVAASDPEGFPISYSHVTNPPNQAQATITESNGTFTFAPSTNANNAGTFTCRFRASDGTHVSSRTSTFSLQFYNGYAAEYLELTGGNLTAVTYSGSGTDNLDAIIDARSQGDAILLGPGTYELTPTNWDNYASSNWRGKDIAIVGMTLDPATVVLNLKDHGARDTPIFSDGTVTTNYYNHFANMRVVRLTDPQATSTHRYKAAIRRGQSGGYVQNCIMDFNGNEVAWIYDNTFSSSPVGSFINCSFVNYNTWLDNYNGNANSIECTNSGFSAGHTATVQATLIGTNATSVSYGVGYTYADNGSTYGHMKGISDTPTVSISAP